MIASTVGDVILFVGFMAVLASFVLAYLWERSR